MHKDNLSYGNTFDEALAGLFKEGAPGTAVKKAPAAPGEASVESLIQRANDAFENYLQHLGRKRFEAASGALENLQQALNQLTRTTAATNSPETSSGMANAQASMTAG
jgi:uncharacterized membrane protein (UPF0182 family)